MRHIMWALICPTQINPPNLAVREVKLGFAVEFERLDIAEN